MNGIWSTLLEVEPSVALPNVRTNGGRHVHVGRFARVRGGKYKVSAWCHEGTAAWWTFQPTGDPVNCSNCHARLRAAAQSAQAATTVEMAELRLKLWAELETHVLNPYPRPWLPVNRYPRPEWMREFRREVNDLKEMVAAATAVDAEDVQDCLALGAETLAALLAELDSGHTAAA